MRHLLILLLMLTAMSAEAQQEQKPTKIYTSNGTTVDSYDFSSFEHLLKTDSDTTYVVNFWATWCGPCVVELPHFEQLRSDYKKSAVKVILVSLDMPKQVESRLIPFIQKKKLLSKVVLLDDPDANSWISKVDKNWSGALPATLIFSKGQRRFYERSFTYNELEKELNQFITKP
ncbi:MAG TPA: redoxin domain-containing protein [Flavobacterium sp.]|jgi:thiol-disulfide isomerase/thioredoxin